LHLHISDHALRRSAERNFSYEDVCFVVDHGEQLHRAGVIFCQMKRKKMPTALPANHRARKLMGTTVVLCRCGDCVLTLYRGERNFGKDRRKRKCNLRTELEHCPYCEDEQTA
jgi:hypothetical protein